MPTPSRGHGTRRVWGRTEPMSVRTAEADAVEQERQRQAAELAAEDGPEWAAEYRPGSAGCHELLDRASLVADLLERHLLSHPACVANPEWYALAARAAAAVHDLYQRVGAEHPGADG